MIYESHFADALKSKWPRALYNTGRFGVLPRCLEMKKSEKTTLRVNKLEIKKLKWIRKTLNCST